MHEVPRFQGSKPKIFSEGSKQATVPRKGSHVPNICISFPNPSPPPLPHGPRSCPLPPVVWGGLGLVVVVVVGVVVGLVVAVVVVVVLCLVVVIIVGVVVVGLLVVVVVVVVVVLVVVHDII